MWTGFLVVLDGDTRACQFPFFRQICLPFLHINRWFKKTKGFPIPPKKKKEPI